LPHHLTVGQRPLTILVNIHTRVFSVSSTFRGMSVGIDFSFGIYC
jgi:hypothetical protein